VDRLGLRARRELVFLALGTMDVCVVTPLLVALLSNLTPVRPVLAGAAFLGTILAVHYLARLAMRLPLRIALRSILLGLGIVASGLLAIHQILHAQTRLGDPAWLVDIFAGIQEQVLPPEVFVLLMVLFLWWRGLLLAQRRIDSESVAFRFRAGLVLIAVTTALAGAVLAWPYQRFVFVFFFASLLGIALARAEEVGEQHGGGRSPFGLGWLAALVVAGLVVLLLAGGLAALLTSENITLMLMPALYVLRLVLFGVVYVVAWIAQIVLAPLLALFRREQFILALEELARRISPPEPFEMEVETRGLPLAPDQLAMLRTVGVILGVLLLLLAVVSSLRRLRARTGPQRDEARESVWEGANLRQGLEDLLRRGRRQLSEAADALGRSSLGRLFVSLTIRRIYAHLTALAAKRGHPRLPYQTPYEYLPVLERTFPDHRPELARITEAYVAVHYGEIPERPDDLAHVRAAWDIVRGQAT
jgi:hypothetical protein